MQTPEYIPYQRKRKWGWIFLAAVAAGLLGAVLLYQIPRVQRAVDWRLDIAYTYLSRLVKPVNPLPPPAVSSHSMEDWETPTPLLPTETPVPTATPAVSPTPTLTPTPIPDEVVLNPPAYDEAKDKQDWNNCGSGQQSS